MATVLTQQIQTKRNIFHNSCYIEYILFTLLEMPITS